MRFSVKAVRKALMERAANERNPIREETDA